MGRADRLKHAGTRAAGLAALVAALLAPAYAAADVPAMGGPRQCRFTVPEGWPVQKARWSGGCRAGLAQGPGALRVYDQGRLVHAFYGRLEGGTPVLGVIDREDGFMAGRFAAGRVVADGDRGAVVKAFDEAAAAARSLAESYRRAGNTASARFYQDKARQLAQQMD